MLTFACTCVAKLMLRGRCDSVTQNASINMSAVFSFGGTTEEICLRRWPDRGRKCKENTPAQRVCAKKECTFCSSPV